MPPFDLDVPAEVLLHTLALSHPPSGTDDGAGRLAEPPTQYAKGLPCLAQPMDVLDADTFERIGSATVWEVHTKTDPEALGIKEADRATVTGPPGTGLPAAGLVLDVLNWKNHSGLGVFWTIRATKRT